MNSSDTWMAPPGPRAAPGDGGASPYTRFIPREELADSAQIAAWTPRVFTDLPRRSNGTDFLPLEHPLDDTPTHRRLVPQLPEATDFTALAQPLPLRRDADHPMPATAGAAPHGGHAGHAPHPAPPSHVPGGHGTAAHPGMHNHPGHQGHHGHHAAHGHHASHGDHQAYRDAVREEVQEALLAEWQEAAEAELQAQVQAARQNGYQDGYRDGLAALDSFKESYAQQVTGQVTALLQGIDAEFTALEQPMAEAVARIATELARQVVRAELAQRPALVARVAQEAVAGLLHNARQVTVAVHPDDHALVAQACADLLEARGAHLLARPDIDRGGCRVDSDIGHVDARIATRWALAAQALGQSTPWHDAEPAVAPRAEAARPNTEAAGPPAVGAMPPTAAAMPSAAAGAPPATGIPPAPAT